MYVCEGFCTGICKWYIIKDTMKNILQVTSEAIF